MHLCTASRFFGSFSSKYRFLLLVQMSVCNKNKPNFSVITEWIFKSGCCRSVGGRSKLTCSLRPEQWRVSEKLPVVGELPAALLKLDQADKSLSSSRSSSLLLFPETKGLFLAG